MEYQTYFTKQFEIDLPDTYIGGDPIRERRALRREVNSLPSDKQSQFMQIFKKAAFSFMAVDSQFKEGQRSPTTCSINMMKVPTRYAELSSEELMKSMVNQLESTTDVQEAEVAEYAGYEGVRLITSRYKSRGLFGMTIGAPRASRREGETAAEKSLTFIFTHAGMFTSVIFASEPEFFADLLPGFEASIRSLKLH